MFSDVYGLTQAVLEGRKTMTRRIIDDSDTQAALEELWEDDNVGGTDWKILLEKTARYKVGDIVAIAQSYRDVFLHLEDDAAKAGFMDDLKYNYWPATRTNQISGWVNKMYVASKLMPHQIEVTAVKIERLQDISPSDALSEGVEKWLDGYIIPGLMARNGQHNKCFDTPCQAFAALIDKLSGAGIWEGNPYVLVYNFILIK